jgi:hypothetical protein
MPRHYRKRRRKRVSPAELASLKVRTRGLRSATRAGALSLDVSRTLIDDVGKNVLATLIFGSDFNG